MIDHSGTDAVCREIITPRFCETDALGHINNVSYAAWLEQGRTGYFKTHTPGGFSPLILAKLEINYRNEAFHGTLVEVQTCLEKLGNTSFTLAQKVYQGDQLVVEAHSVLVNFDHGLKQKAPFNDSERLHWQALEVENF